MSILDCLGQDRAIARLQAARRAHRLSHSYIFHGPEGVGKSLLARQWAKLLLCAAPIRRSSARPDQPDNSSAEIEDCCDQCSSCRLAQTGNHPDLHIVNKELIPFAREGRDRKMINLPIHIIREFVIEPAGLMPSCGLARVFIIEQAEDMNRAAQNALLKTLEEPPASTFLILISSQIEQFLPTVRSRCQVVRFVRLGSDLITDHLQRSSVDPVEARYWADFSDGRLGPALQLARAGLYPKKRELVEQLARLNHGSVLLIAAWIVQQAKSYAQFYLKEHPQYSQTAASRQAHHYWLGVIIHALAQALRCLAGLSGAAGTLNQAGALDQAGDIEQLANRFGLAGCADAIGATVRAQGLLEANTNPALVFESLLLQYLDYVSHGPVALTSDSKIDRPSGANNRHN